MHQRSSKNGVVGEFCLRSQNSRAAPLFLRWKASESLYYGGDLRVVSGPGGLRARFENRMSDHSWLKNDPTRIAGGRPFTESFFATVAVLMAFAEAERLMIECVQSPVPMTSTQIKPGAGGQYKDIEEFDRGERNRRDVAADSRPTDVSGTLRAG